MKISTFITTLLVVGILLFVMISMMQESETHYGVDINKTDWEDKYDFASEVNESIYPVQRDLEKIANEETGWLEKVGAGFTGIIAAVKVIPTMVWEMSKMGTTLIVGMGKTLGIPSEIIYIIIIMLVVWGIIKLIEFFQRWNI